MSVKRYFCNDSDGECCGLLYEHPNGVCVGYLDYRTLEAERDALKGLNGELVEVVKPALEQIREYASSIMYHTEDDHIAHYVDQINNWCEAALIRANQRER